MDRESLLTKDDIEKLKSWSDGYFYKIFYYLEDFIAKGVEEKSFTLEEARADLEIALWYAYAGNNIDVYEYYYKVINWMPFSEDNAKGCGAWFYRYSVALLYCSKIKEAYEYAQKGIKEEPSYPWGWLNLAKLHYYFGRKEEAISAIEYGSNLVEDKHEFTILRKEIDEGCSLEQLLCHYIKEDDDKTLQSEENEAELVEKLQAINGVVCDRDNLNVIKNILKAQSWQENMPYCSLESCFYNEQIVKFVFTMNSASLSKIKKSWIEDLLTSINDKLVIKKYGKDYKLIQLEVSRNLEVKFTYYDEFTDRVLLDYQVEESVISASQNGQMGNIALTLLRQSDAIEYIECWLEDDKIVKHFGDVGDKGQLKVYENCSAEDYKMYLDIFIGRYEKLGYISWKDFPKRSVVLRLDIACEDKSIFQEDKSSPVYFVYEMMQKLLEINVIGFFNDWGFKANEEKNSYEVDFYFDTVDEDLFMRLLKASLKVFDMKSMITIKSLNPIKE